MSAEKNCHRVTVDGLILAGGQSRRMGQDKAHLEIAGLSLLEHHIKLMRPKVAHLFVAANHVLKERHVADVIEIEDYFADAQGPLSGILSGLHTSNAEYLWVMSCDNFGLSADVLDMLYSALNESGSDIACIEVDGRSQPLIALLKVHLKASLDSYMANGARAVLRWYDSVDVVTVKIKSDNQRYNMNTIEDFEAAKASLK